MADELTLKVTFNYNPSTAGEASVTPAEQSGTFDVTATAVTTGTQVITTGGIRDLNLGDVTDPGYIMVKNVSTSDFVEINGEDPTLYYAIKLKAGEFAVWRWGDNAATPTLRCLADTSNQTIQYWMISD